MGKFEERQLEYQHACIGCNHGLAGEAPEFCMFCMLGVSPEDVNHVQKIMRGEKKPDAHYVELMKLNSIDANFFGSPRAVDSACVCQFYDRRYFGP